MKLSEKINYQAGIGGYSNNMAQIYIKKGEFHKAIPLLNDGIEILKKLGAIDNLFCYIGRAFCHMKIGQEKKVQLDMGHIEKLLKNGK